jgi:hypothetical protein
MALQEAGSVGFCLIIWATCGAISLLGKHVYWANTCSSIDFSNLNTVVYMCTTYFNTKKPFILPTQCIYVFRMVLTVNSDCFPKQH